MKALSVLLLLAVGVGAAWWKTTWPDDTAAAARERVAAVGERLRGALDALGGGVAVPEALRGDGGRAADTAAADTAAAGTGDEPAETAAAEPFDPAPDASPDIATALPVPDSPAPPAPAAASPVPMVSAVRERLDAAERRLDAAAARETAMLEQIDALDEALATRAVEPDAAAPSEALAARLDALDGRLDGLGERLDEALGARDASDEAGASAVRETLARLDATDAALARLEARDEALGARLDTLSAARLVDLGPPGPLPPRVDAPGEGADEPSGDAAPRTAGARTDGAPTVPDAVASRLDALAAGLDRRLAALENKLGAVGDAPARLARLDERLGTLDERVGALADAVPAAVSVDALQSELQGQLAALDERVDERTTTDDAPALGAALERTRERLAALEARVQELPASSDAADDALATQADLEAQIAGLQARLEALPAGTDPELVNSLSEVRERVDALSSRDFVTREDLRAQVEGRHVEYKIYFERGSTEVSEEAARVLDSFIAQEQNRTTGVSIFGFTDRQGSASYNQRLALERATNVRSYLIQNGLPYTKIRTLSGLGEDAAAAILPDEAEDAQQRVVVLFAAQP